MTAKTVQKKKETAIEEAIKKGKQILWQLHPNTFFKYREVGKLILASGYKRGKWRSKHRQKAIEQWAISRRTFSNMVQLGEMTDEEFGNVIAKFPSVYAWAHRHIERGETVFPPLPDGKFRTIIVDPPWAMKRILRVERPLQEENLDYQTLTIEQIKSDVGKLIREKAAENCHVYLWTTHKFLPKALEIFEAWGVDYECLLTWVKNVGFTPFSWMYSTEHILFGRIGSLELLKKGERLDFKAKVREHSRKPDEFYELVRKVSPSPRIDFFSREKREGFEPWGNEVAKFNVIRTR